MADRAYDLGRILERQEEGVRFENASRVNQRRDGCNLDEEKIDATLVHMLLDALQHADDNARVHVKRVLIELTSRDGNITFPFSSATLCSAFVSPEGAVP